MEINFNHKLWLWLYSWLPRYWQYSSEYHWHAMGQSCMEAPHNLLPRTQWSVHPSPDLRVSPFFSVLSYAIVEWTLKREAEYLVLRVNVEQTKMALCHGFGYLRDGADSASKTRSHTTWTKEPNGANYIGDVGVKYFTFDGLLWKRSMCL